MSLDTGVEAPVEERLSTRPTTERVRTGSLLAPFRQAWRTLTSMRTALLLLFLLAVAAVPGGFLPQRPVSPVAVQDYLVANPTLGPLLDRVGMFDVFAAPWFAAIYLLLTISLVGCVVPRWRLHAKAMLTPPPRAPSVMGRLPSSARWETDADAEAVLAAARSALRRSRWRTVRRDGAVSAEKGYLRETGNLVFHVSLVVLLVAVAIGSFFGFNGSVLVTEGRGFANTVFSYDDVDPGTRFDDARLVPFAFDLEDFRATYDEQGRALTFEADLAYVSEPGAPEQVKTVEVNDPLTVGDARVYLIGHGYSPSVEVRDPSGELVFDQSVPCLPQDARFISLCTIKVPGAQTADGEPVEYGFDGLFTPTTFQDPETGQVTSVYPAPDNPALTVVAYTGDLGLSSGIPQSVYELELDRLTEVDAPPQALQVGDTWTMPDGASITLTGVDEWATFSVAQDPGKVLALVAAVLMTTGLMLSLFIRRRRVWVRVTPAGGPGSSGPTVVEAGGLARTSPEAFDTEFTELVERLKAAAPERTTTHG